MFVRYLILALTVFPLFIQSFAQPDVPELAFKINEVLTDTFFNRCNIAIDIYDLTDQKYLFQK